MPRDCLLMRGLKASLRSVLLLDCDLDAMAYESAAPRERRLKQDFLAGWLLGARADHQVGLERSPI